MKWTVVFICVALCAVSALSLADNEKKPHPPATVDPASEFDKNDTTTQATTTAKSTTTTAKSTTTTAKTTTTTAKTTTTTPKTTTTTAKTTTTTPKTTTTTAKTTTTTAKTTTTTAKTTTTTAKTTTTTPKTTAPSPTPTASTTMRVGKYNVTVDKKTCLMAQMALQIRLETSKSKGAFIVQPDLTTAEGSCEENKANLTLDFKEGHITFLFNKDSVNQTVYVSALSFALSYPLSKGSSKYTAANNSVNLFAAKVSHSYSCKSESVYMGSGLYLDVKQDRMQAFNLTASNDFGLPDHCTADQSDYRVAIAVGVTLLVLIIIVVVAYLLGRKRRTDGYQSL